VAVAAPVTLAPGTVYRTAALRRWGQNPTRLAARLERDGLLKRLGHGLVYVPRKTRFGDAPPTEQALLDAFLDGTPYLVTGPPRWNALGLGSTALHVRPLVYNTKRTGAFTLGGRTFELRRVGFPSEVTPEWFVVDLLRNSDAAGVDRSDLVVNLVKALRAGRFDPRRLLQMADQFGDRAVADLVRQAVVAEVIR
jgi:hypothetical protein